MIVSLRRSAILAMPRKIKRVLWGDRPQAERSVAPKQTPSMVESFERMLAHPLEIVRLMED